jgi:hypothetical protein
MFPIPNSNDFLLIATRSGDQKKIIFRAVERSRNLFEIKVYPSALNMPISPFLLADKDTDGAEAVTFEVMVSNEVGAEKKAMTGDYDLFAVCPLWADLTSRFIQKEAICLDETTRHRDLPQLKGLTFDIGQGMDNVLDTRLHTMSKQGDYALRQRIYKERIEKGSFNSSPKSFTGYLKNAEHQPGSISAASTATIEDDTPYNEHGDMGNLTPRILRCINEMNKTMNAAGDRAALRRVHHNAESHRYRDFGALTRNDMLTIKSGETYGDGFPLTAFHPEALATTHSDILNVTFSDVCTIENLADFRIYAQSLKAAGYFVPKNWIWEV